jgi:hypothetical protein
VIDLEGSNTNPVLVIDDTILGELFDGGSNAFGR